ncbi:PAS domain-containing protein [Saccharicrinis sp. FJH62]|uniref:PAS domain-containing protein n=1 Tax=Saccharicrinis sp. FJH62 TaxID=3344657 RepID=UPI0035D4039C
MFDWIKEFDGAVTVCDENFTIIYMNDTSIRDFNKYGGQSLIGQSLLDCHNEHSQKMIRQQMKTGESHTYMKNKKDGRKKVIHQSPWLEKGKIKGLIEISFYM